MHVRACVCLYAFHFSVFISCSSLSLRNGKTSSLIKSVNLSHFVWEKCDHQLSLCSASIFLTLSIPSHIELLDKFVHVTPWELREQSAWWVTWNFSVIPSHFLSLSLREINIPFSWSVSQSLSLCMETFVINNSHSAAPSKAVKKCRFSLTL